MRTTDEMADEHLARSDLFGRLDKDCRSAVARRLLPATFEAGQVIFLRGDLGAELFVIIEGRIRISVITLDGRELAFDHSTPGAVVGEIAVLDGSARSATATALTHCRAMKLTRAALLELIATHQEIAQAVIVFLCGRLRHVSDQLEDIALLPVEVRLARYLVRRLDEGQPMSLDGMRQLSLDVSQTELGYLLGASRQKINGALASLEARNAVRRIGNTLECAPAILAQIG